MKQETLIARQRAVISNNQKSVTELLCWTEDAYSVNLYQTGLAYLEAYFQSDLFAIKILEERKEFWNWWKMRWSSRDEIFIELCEEHPMSQKERTEIYTDMTHNPVVLASEICPPRPAFGPRFTTINIKLPC